MRSAGPPPAPVSFALTSLGASTDPLISYAGRVPVFPDLIFREHTTVLIFFGDSLASPTDNVAFTPVNAAKIHDLSLDNGKLYEAKTPALSGGGPGNSPSMGFWGHRLADKLITNGKTARVISVGLGVNYTGTELWKTAPYTRRFTLAWQWLDVLGLLAADRMFILSSIGGLDQINAVSAATVKTNLDAIILSIRNAGFLSTPVILARSSWGNGATGGVSGTNVRTGITNAAAGNANTSLGFDTDTVGLGGRYDANHYNATGSDAVATGWYNVIQGNFP